MKKFLIKTSIALFLAASLHIVTVLLFANGKIDPFYLRFTTGRQASFILGNSRAAQGIVPEVINKELGDKYLPVFNFSFTLSSSPYGPYYLESVRRKIMPGVKNGLYILAVDPMAISYEGSDDITKYPEARSAPHNVKYSSMKPNLEYLSRNYTKGWGDMIIANTVRHTQQELHEDGWLEISIPMNKARQQERIRERVEKYFNKYFSVRKFSPKRLQYLKETIQYLENFGTVVLVRIPVDPRMLELETGYMPEFDSLMHALAASERVSYFDYSADGSKYTTTDGNHLYKESAKEFSKQLAEGIKNLNHE